MKGKLNVTAVACLPVVVMLLPVLSLAQTIHPATAPSKKENESVVTQQPITVNGQPLKYKATAGTLTRKQIVDRLVQYIGLHPPT